MVVSENSGDIIFTNDFRSFLEETKLRMYVCRKSDPESKGKIENVIKYVKYNFFGSRQFDNLEDAQNGLRKWLSRRANGKINQSTRRIPSEEIIIERHHLKSVTNSIFRKESLLSREERTVNEHSFISVNASLYSVPNKYRNKTVEIYSVQNELYIFDRLTGKEIAKHKLSIISGNKIINRTHFREKEKSSKELQVKSYNFV